MSFKGLESASKGSLGLEQVEPAQEEKQPGGSVDPSLGSTSTRGSSSRAALFTRWQGRGARRGEMGSGGVWPSAEGGVRRPQRRKRVGGCVEDRGVESLGKGCRGQRLGAAPRPCESGPHPGLCGRRRLLRQRPPRRPSGEPCCPKTQHLHFHAAREAASLHPVRTDMI